MVVGEVGAGKDKEEDNERAQLKMTSLKMP